MNALLRSLSKLLLSHFGGRRLLYWATLGLLLGLAWLSSSDAYAGYTGRQPNQTLPTATPTSEPPPLPTVTNTFTPAPPTATSAPPTNTPVPPTNTPAPPTQTPTRQAGGGSGGGATNTPAPLPTATNTQTATVVPTAAPTQTPTRQATRAAAPPTPTPAFALDLEMQYAPPFPLPGDEVQISYVVHNPSQEPAVNVQLRNLMPPGLEFIGGESETGVLEQESDFGGGLVILFRWDAISPGESVQATVTVRLSPDDPPGLVIDNLAVVFADNASPTSAGVSIGLPPAILPTFGG